MPLFRVRRALPALSAALGGLSPAPEARAPPQSPDPCASCPALGLVRERTVASARQTAQQTSVPRQIEIPTGL